jgi:hypothetical protein
VPVLLTTSNPAIGAEWARGHGCAGFVRKPVNPDVLLTAVRSCLPGAG